MKAKLRWAAGTIAVLVTVVLGAGVHTVWPFFAYPVTELRITNATSKTPLDVPAMMAGVAERDITTPIGIPKFGRHENLIARQSASPDRFAHFLLIIV